MPTPLALNKAQRMEAARMYEEEMHSIRQIAEHFERSAMAVKNALAAEGVKMREKHQARVIRDSFPCKRYPNGRQPDSQPQQRFKRVNSVFQLGAM